MAYEHPAFVTDEYYHVFNRGVAKQQIFHDEHDHLRFLQTLSFYRESKPETKLSLIAPERMQTILAEEPVSPLVEILAYCLMPNHFHLLLKQNTDGGISFFSSNCRTAMAVSTTRSVIGLEPFSRGHSKLSLSRPMNSYYI